VIGLALTIALSMMGMGYAQQNGGAQNNNEVVLSDGSGFIWAVSNDDGTEQTAGGFDPIDPGDDGGGTAFDGWGDQSSDDPSEPQLMGEPCARYGKDVARTTAEVDADGKGITVVLENAYPCYHPTVFFAIRGPDWGPTSVISIAIENDHPDELIITTSGIFVGQPIPAGEEIVGAVHAHVEQAAEQNATYTFRIIITIVTTNSPNNNDNPSCPEGGCVRLLTVDWDEEITTSCLDPADRLTGDMFAPCPLGKHNLRLETRTRAPDVGPTRHYLLIIRELEECPPAPANMVCVAAFSMSPPGALFDRDIFLTLGADELPDDAVDATIAYYDEVNGVWVPLYSEPGEPNGVAEITLTAAFDHFSIFGLLVDVDPSARFVAGNLDITIGVEKIWDPVAFLTRTGREATISADVANKGRWRGEFTVVLKLDGEETDSHTITLGGGQSTEVAFTVTGMEYGIHEVEVAGLSGEFETSWSLRWWLIAVILAAIGLIMWGVGRDRKRRRARREA